jgi:glycerophosphoryl diester phosphodiesterase
MSGLTRRRFGALAAAAGLVPSLARADPPTPLVIAEGGAAGERPEDTRLAFDLAINEGADFLQANLVPTKDGVLVARRGNELSATTDVAGRPAFAERKTTRTIDGADVTGWFAEDFTLAELKTLACRERLPRLRPQSAKFDGLQPVLTFQEVLEIARLGCVRTARTIGVIPRMLHVSYFAGLDLIIEQRLANDLNSAGYNSEAAAIWVQAFEPDALKALGRLTQVKRVQLIDAPASSDAAAAVAEMTTSAGLADIRAYAQAVGPHQDLLMAPDAAVFPAPTTLVLDAHGVGLAVHSRTACAENAFLPRLLQKGDPQSADFSARHGDVDKLMVALFAAGVDGLCTSVPKQAARDRGKAIQLIEQSRAKRG